MPVRWDELASLTGGAHWCAARLAARLSVGNSPWASYEKSRHALSGAMKQPGFKVGTKAVRLPRQL